jgi:GrpB-like predicted nucleotidyltransferase (UPF0157 family)
MPVRIEHVGSTAVPGLAGKDVIDVQIAVRADEVLDQAADVLAGDGWRLHPEIRRDHAVVGLPDEPQEWIKRFFTEPTGDRRINVHLRGLGRANARYALLAVTSAADAASTGPRPQRPAAATARAISPSR